MTNHLGTIYPIGLLILIGISGVLATCGVDNQGLPSQACYVAELRPGLPPSIEVSNCPVGQECSFLNVLDHGPLFYFKSCLPENITSPVPTAPACRLFDDYKDISILEVQGEDDRIFPQQILNMSCSCEGQHYLLREETQEDGKRLFLYSCSKTADEIQFCKVETEQEVVHEDADTHNQSCSTEPTFHLTTTGEYENNYTVYMRDESAEMILNLSECTTENEGDLIIRYDKYDRFASTLVTMASCRCPDNMYKKTRLIAARQYDLYRCKRQPQKQETKGIEETVHGTLEE